MCVFVSMRVHIVSLFLLLPVFCLWPAILNRANAAATFFICCQFIAAMMMIVKLPKARTVTTVNRIQSLLTKLAVFISIRLFSDL